MNIGKNKKGFTLMELVVTTAIMGTLATVAVPSYLEIQAKTKATKTMANISEMGSEVGRKFNSLSSTYGRVQLGTGSVQLGITVINNSQILNAGSSSGAVEEIYFWGP
ncbi:MAG: prepilin-type N-terminal cleavage/methylation domain-containing protein, partial [Candidatus Marinimicrobia bacterium]|nr:prepilin-type N-terminal cleavage/methylation domain-containing protein [Candidatus Neomarinimicrobiota bacterium]